MSEQKVTVRVLDTPTHDYEKWPMDASLIPTSDDAARYLMALVIASSVLSGGSDE